MSDLDLAWKNRRLLAERLGWPEGALADCEYVTRHYRRWWAVWLSEITAPGFEAPAGYYATHERGYGRRRRWVYGRDVAGLIEGIVLRQEQLETEAAEAERWRAAAWGRR